MRIVVEGIMLCGLFEKEVEGIDRREFGDQLDVDFELAKRLRQNDARQIVSERILLPIDETTGGGNIQRVGCNPGSAMGPWPQSDYMR